MQTKKRDRDGEGRLFFFISSAIPFFILLIGLFSLIFAGAQFTLGFVLTFLLFPTLAILIDYFISRTNNHIIAKIITVILSTWLFLYVSVFSLLFNYLENVLTLYNSSAIGAYTRAVSKHEEMPTKDELGEVVSSKYQYYCFTHFFSHESYTLICKYTEEGYEEQKAALLDGYTYESEPIVDDEHVCEPNATVKGFTFRMLDSETYDLNHPKVVMLFGTNDETGEIAYIYFYDPDLDYINSLEDFIAKTCAFVRIR